MTKVIEYKQIKRYGPIRKAIMQIISTRVSWFVAIGGYAENCISGMEKLQQLMFFPGLWCNGKLIGLNNCLEVILVISCLPYSEFLSSASSKTRVFSKYSVNPKKKIFISH